MAKHFIVREITPDDTHEIHASSYEFSDSFLRIVDKMNVLMNEKGEVVVEVIYGL